MQTDVLQFFRHLCLNNVVASPFYDKPVLASIAPKEFVRRVLALSPPIQASVFSTFKGRYERGALEKELHEEKPWLIQVKQEFEKEAAKLGPMSRFRVSSRVTSNIDVFVKDGLSATP